MPVSPSQRPSLGRGLFYTRDSGGEHETTPGEYVRWANARPPLWVSASAAHPSTSRP